MVTTSNQLDLRLYQKLCIAGKTVRREILKFKYCFLTAFPSSRQIFPSSAMLLASQSYYVASGEVRISNIEIKNPPLKFVVFG